MADDIKNDPTTGQDALAVELLNNTRGAAGRAEDLEHGRSFDGEINAENEAGGGAENVYLSGLLSEYSGVTDRRPNGEDRLTTDIESTSEHIDPIRSTGGGPSSADTEGEQALDSMMLSSADMVENRAVPLSTASGSRGPAART